MNNSKGLYINESLFYYDDGTDKKYDIYDSNPFSEYVKNILGQTSFTYYPELDHYGDDLIYVGRLSIEELKKKCIELKGVAFNTYGYIKHKVSDPSAFIKLPSGEGIYVLQHQT